MSSGSAKFSGGKHIEVPDISGEVRNALLIAIPALFESVEEQEARSHQQRVEHEDYAGTLAEIEGAVWIAAKVMRAFQGTNSAADTRKEIEAIAKGGFIPRLESELDQIGPWKISGETWWALVESCDQIPQQLDEFVTAARAARQMLTSSSMIKPRPQEINHWAASEMTKRIVGALYGNAEALGIPLVSYSYNQERPTRIVKLLKALGEIAGVFLGDGTWRNHLASARNQITQ